MTSRSLRTFLSASLIASLSFATPVFAGGGPADRAAVVSPSEDESRARALDAAEEDDLFAELAAVEDTRLARQTGGGHGGDALACVGLLLVLLGLRGSGRGLSMRVHPIAWLVLALAPLASGCAGTGTQYDSLQELRADASSSAVVLPVPLTRQKTNTLCGRACVDSLLRMNGQTLDARAKDRFSTRRSDANDGIAAGELKAYLIGRGHRAVLVHGHLDHRRPTGLLGLLEKGLPPMVKLVTKHLTGNAHHYVVVCGFDPKRKAVFVMDPAEGFRVIPYERFDELWKPAQRLMLVAAPPRRS